MKKFEITVNSKEKTINISFFESFLEEDAGQFIREYSSTITSLSSYEYYLVIDFSKFGMLKGDFIPSIQGCFMIFISSTFKNIIIINPSSVTGAMQLKRAASSVGLKAKFVDRLVEVYGLIKKS